MGEKTGTLVNVSSSLALCALPTQASYCCSKLAAVRLLESLHWGESARTGRVLLTIGRSSKSSSVLTPSRSGEDCDECEICI